MGFFKGGRNKSWSLTRVVARRASTVYTINSFMYFELDIDDMESSKLRQEPITRSVQLPYRVCETAFSQVELFLNQPFPRISFG